MFLDKLDVDANTDNPHERSHGSQYVDIVQEHGSQSVAPLQRVLVALWTLLHQHGLDCKKMAMACRWTVRETGRPPATPASRRPKPQRET